MFAFMSSQNFVLDAEDRMSKPRPRTIEREKILYSRPVLPRWLHVCANSFIKRWSSEDYRMNTQTHTQRTDQATRYSEVFGNCILLPHPFPRVALRPLWKPVVNSTVGYRRHHSPNTFLCTLSHKNASGGKIIITRMWVYAQRDGRPAKYRLCPLFNAAKFGWRPLLECRAVMLRRSETRWNLQGCPKLLNRSPMLVGWSR